MDNLNKKNNNLTHKVLTIKEITTIEKTLLLKSKDLYNRLQTIQKKEYKKVRDFINDVNNITKNFNIQIFGTAFTDYGVDGYILETKTNKEYTVYFGLIVNNKTNLYMYIEDITKAYYSLNAGIINYTPLFIEELKKI